MLLVNFKPKRAAAALSGFLATARLSCFIGHVVENSIKGLGLVLTSVRPNYKNASRWWMQIPHQPMKRDGSGDCESYQQTRSSNCELHK